MVCRCRRRHERRIASSTRVLPARRRPRSLLCPASSPIHGQASNFERFIFDLLTARRGCHAPRRDEALAHDSPSTWPAPVRHSRHLHTRGPPRRNRAHGEAACSSTAHGRWRASPARSRSKRPLVVMEPRAPVADTILGRHLPPATPRHRRPRGARHTARQLRRTSKALIAEARAPRRLSLLSPMARAPPAKPRASPDGTGLVTPPGRLPSFLTVGLMPCCTVQSAPEPGHREGRHLCGAVTARRAAVSLHFDPLAALLRRLPGHRAVSPTSTTDLQGRLGLAWAYRSTRIHQAYETLGITGLRTSRAPPATSRPEVTSSSASSTYSDGRGNVYFDVLQPDTPASA